MVETKKKGKKRPAKRPPPKNVLATARAKTLIELPGPDPVEMRPGYGKSEKSRLNYIRSMAGTIFMVDPTLPTIEDIHAHEPFNQVTLSRLRNWAYQDRWNEKRREFLEGINAGVRRKLGNRLIQQQMKILQDSDVIYSKNVEFLTGQSGVEIPAPKSYESLLRAHTQFVRVINEMGRDVIDAVVPPVIPETDGEEISRVMPELSSEEARIAALAVVQERRRLRNRNPDEGDDDG